MPVFLLHAFADWTSLNSLGERVSLICNLEDNGLIINLTPNFFWTIPSPFHLIFFQNGLFVLANIVLDWCPSFICNNIDRRPQIGQISTSKTFRVYLAQVGKKGKRFMYDGRRHKGSRNSNKMSLFSKNNTNWIFAQKVSKVYKQYGLVLF